MSTRCDRPLVFIDTETISLHPMADVWEVAAIRRETDGRRSLLHMFVDDVDLSRADPAALRVGGFYGRHPRYVGRALAPLAGDDLQADSTIRGTGEWRAVARQVEKVTRGAILVGVHPAFDAERLGWGLRSARLCPGWHYWPIDLVAAAVGFLAAIGVEDVLDLGSDELSRRCGVDPPQGTDRHSALGDALWAERWFDALTFPQAENLREGSEVLS